MKANSRKKALLQKYLEDQCTHAELEELFHYLSSGQDDDYQEVMAELWENITEEKILQTEQADRLLNQVFQTGKSVQPEPSGSTSHLSSGRSTFRWYQAAAVFAGVLGLSLLYFLFSNNYGITEYTTAYGETKAIVLPDSSSVMLNSNSYLAYNTDWETREVQLQGEAFFEVKKKTETKYAKFTVIAENLAVEVLGTQFNVNTRRKKTQVVLNSGKVKLVDMSVNEVVMMDPGEMAEYAKGQEITKKVVDVELYTSWRKNELVFQESSLREIARLLEDNYGFKVIIEEEELAEKEFTGTFPSDKLDVLLKAMSEVHDIQIQEENETIRINKKRK